MFLARHQTVRYQRTIVGKHVTTLRCNSLCARLYCLHSDSLYTGPELIVYVMVFSSLYFRTHTIMVCTARAILFLLQVFGPRLLEFVIVQVR